MLRTALTCHVEGNKDLSVTLILPKKVTEHFHIAYASLCENFLSVQTIELHLPHLEPQWAI